MILGTTSARSTRVVDPLTSDSQMIPGQDTLPPSVGVFAIKLVICKYDLNINKRSSIFIHFVSYFKYITCALNIQDCQM